MSSSSDKKTTPSWLWYLFGLLVTAFAIAWVLTSKDITKDDGATLKVKVEAKTQEVIVLKPGQTISLEINNKEWSPWIDATYSGMHYYAHAENGLIFKFRNGKIKKVTPDKIENFGNGSHLFMFRLKSVSESDRAVIETSMESIVEKHIN
jgi:hypothetical protein